MNTSSKIRKELTRDALAVLGILFLLLVLTLARYLYLNIEYDGSVVRVVFYWIFWTGVVIFTAITDPSAAVESLMAKVSCPLILLLVIGAFALYAIVQIARRVFASTRVI